MRPVLLSFALAALTSAAALASPRIDNVLEKMVPPGATSLAGAHLDQLRQTEMYRRLPPPVLDELNRFPQNAAGFDPRRDVREVLYARTPSGGVLLARGTFPAKQTQWKDAVPKRHGQYTLWVSGRSAFCILDATLAGAGETPALEAALDEWTAGAHTTAQPLLARASLVAPQSQVWGISADLAAAFASRVLPDGAPGRRPTPGNDSNGFVFAKALNGLGECWFQADLSTGIHMELHGVTATDPDAVSLRDAVRGVVGLGRLNVPEDQPELLRVWDGIVVDQKGRSITLRADIPQNLADKLMDSLGSDANGQKRRVL